MSKVYYSDQEYEQLLLTLSKLTEQIEKIDDPMAKEMVYHILQHFDAIHREALHRLWQFVRKQHPQMRERLLSDYTIKHLLSLYDLEAFEGITKPKNKTIFVSEDQVTKL